jgi:hypothetical protein
MGEELLLGLGARVGFAYWRINGMPPTLGSPANVGRPGVKGLEKAVQEEATWSELDALA